MATAEPQSRRASDLHLLALYPSRVDANLQLRTDGLEPELDLLHALGDRIPFVIQPL